jgi:hypothetical protein
MDWRYICSVVEISDFKKAVSGGHADDPFHLVRIIRIINGLNEVTGASVEKSNTTIYWGG